MKFGKIIADACRAQGVTKSELARALGHSPAWVSQLFASANLTENTLRECARALDLDVEVRVLPRRAARGRIRARQILASTRRPRRRSNGKE